MRLAEAIRSALNALGFDVTLQALPFDEASTLILAQRHDMALLGWEQVGPEPAAGPWFDSRADLPGAGVNVTSYQNPVVDTLFDAARTVPGCDLQARGDLYRQIQRQVAGEVALLPLNGTVNHVGIGAAWRGVAPGPWGMDAGVEGWEKQ
jgi:ABC-type transport system substrate-binding protein